MKISRNELFDKLQNAKSDPQFWQSLLATDACLLDYKLFETSSNTETSSSAHTNKMKKIGISSVLVPIATIASQSDFEVTIDKYLNKLALDIFVIMSITVSNNNNNTEKNKASDVKRQLLICSKNKVLIDELDRYLNNDKFQLSLQTIKSSNKQPPHSLQTVATQDKSSINSNHDAAAPTIELIVSQKESEPLLESNLSYSMIIYDQQNLKISRKQLAPILLDFYSK